MYHQDGVLSIACSNAQLSLLRKESLQQAGLGTMVILGLFCCLFDVSLAGHAHKFVSVPSLSLPR